MGRVHPGVAVTRYCLYPIRSRYTMCYFQHSNSWFSAHPTPPSEAHRLASTPDDDRSMFQLHVVRAVKRARMFRGGTLGGISPATLMK